MGEDRRAVIEAALPRPLDPSPEFARTQRVIAEQIERAVAAWERSREPTDAEIDAAFTASGLHDLSEMAAILRAARDVKENIE
jgi:hypothetical protein